MHCPLSMFRSLNILSTSVSLDLLRGIVVFLIEAFSTRFKWHQICVVETGKWIYGSHHGVVVNSGILESGDPGSILYSPK